MKKHLVIILIAVMFLSCFDKPQKVNTNQVPNTTRESKRETDEEIYANILGWIKPASIFEQSDNYYFSGYKIISETDGQVILTTRNIKADYDFNRIGIYFHLNDSLTRENREKNVTVWLKLSSDSLSWTDWIHREYSMVDEAPTEFGTVWGSKLNLNEETDFFRYYKIKIEIEIGEVNKVVLKEFSLELKNYQQRNSSQEIEQNIQIQKAQNDQVRRVLNKIKKKNKPKQN